MPTTDPDIRPDDKDWTWTVLRPCPECGYDASVVEAGAVADEVRRLTAPWPAVLGRADVGDRPRPQTWSPLEYACHVRDVCRVFEGRVRLMLDRDDPTFDDWDQDRAAVDGAYATQEPGPVGAELGSAAEAFAELLASVGAGQWERRGLRSNGSAFTVLTLGRYGLHDLAHHLGDVRAAATPR